MPKDTSVATQLGRVIAVMLDGRERTLRRIESEIFSRFGHGDTQAAISARPREVAAYGYEKITRTETINGKLVWWYRLVPATSKAVAQEVAA